MSRRRELSGDPFAPHFLPRAPNELGALLGFLCLVDLSTQARCNDGAKERGGLSAKR